MMDNLWGFTALLFSIFLQILIGVLLFKLSIEYDREIGNFFRVLLFLYIFWETFHIGYNLLLFYTTIR